MKYFLERKVSYVIFICLTFKPKISNNTILMNAENCLILSLRARLNHMLMFDQYEDIPQPRLELHTHVLYKNTQVKISNIE